MSFDLHCGCVSCHQIVNANAFVPPLMVYSQLLPAHITQLVLFGSSVAPCWPVCSVCMAFWWPPTPGRWLLAQSPSPSVWCPWTCSLAMTRSVAGTLTAPKWRRWVNKMIVLIICSSASTTTQHKVTDQEICTVFLPVTHIICHTFVLTVYYNYPDYINY